VAGSGAGERGWAMHAAPGYVPLGFQVATTSFVGVEEKTH